MPTSSGTSSPTALPARYQATTAVGRRDLEDEGQGQNEGKLTSNGEVCSQSSPAPCSCWTLSATMSGRLQCATLPAAASASWRSATPTCATSRSSSCRRTSSGACPGGLEVVGGSFDRGVTCGHGQGCRTTPTVVPCSTQAAVPRPRSRDRRLRQPDQQLHPGVRVQRRNRDCQNLLCRSLWLRLEP